MNKQLYFVFGFLSAILLTSMFATVSAAGIGGWVKSAFAPAHVAPEVEGDGEVQLAPMPSGSPYSCQANSDTRTRTLQACQWVKSPLGEFTNLKVGSSIDAGEIKTGSLVSVGQMWGENLKIKEILLAGSATGYRIKAMYDERQNGEVLFFTGQDNNYTGDANIVVNGEIWSEGMTSGSIEITDLTGTGNDYACIDANGRLFRSNTAC